MAKSKKPHKKHEAHTVEVVQPVVQNEIAPAEKPFTKTQQIVETTVRVVEAATNMFKNVSGVTKKARKYRLIILFTIVGFIIVFAVVIALLVLLLNKK